MDLINKPIAWLLNLCGLLTNKYVFTLLFFAILMKVILVFLGVKQHKNSIKQANLRPREAAIMKKYKGRNDRASQMKRQQEIQLLHQSGGYSQFAGCLPMIVQLVLIIFILNIIRSPLTYLCNLDSKTIQSIYNLSGTKDEISAISAMWWNFDAYKAAIPALANMSRDMLPNFYLFGQNLAQTPEFGSWLVLIPLLTFVLVFFSSKMQRKLMYQSPQMQGNGVDVKTSLAIMDIAMPALSTFVTFGVPGVIGIYWIYQSVLGVLQQFILVKLMPYPTFTEEDYKEAEREIMGKKKKKIKKIIKDPDRPRVRSLHHIDDDEYNAKVVDNGAPRSTYVETDRSGMLAPVANKESDQPIEKLPAGSKPKIKD